MPGRSASFVAAAITDALDGYFARLLKQDTPIGRQLDPLIDKVIVSGCYIYLVTIPGTGVAPWMVTVIVVRELLIQGLRSHLEGKGQAFGARTAGKLKTLVQCLSIVAILLVLTPSDPNPRSLSQWPATRSPTLPWPSRSTAASVMLWSLCLACARHRDVVRSVAFWVVRHRYITSGTTMMEWLESLVLGLVQGITEFLPISSDGHLLITQNLFRLAHRSSSFRQGEPVF